MRLKNYLKYFLIILLIAIITAAIVVGINFKKNNIKSKVSTTGIAQTTVNESTATASTKKVNEEFYSSSSSDIANYSLISPKGWDLTEYENGVRSIVKRISSSGSESIIVSVEKSDELNEIKSESEIPEKYFSGLQDIKTKVELSPEDITISEIPAKIYGYEYLLMLGDGQKAVDMISYIKNDGCLYIIKYMGINIDTSTALSDFKSFLQNFSLKSTEKSVKKPQKQNSVNILILGDDSAFDRPGGRVNGRTDIIIIFHLNLDSGEGTIVTIPRDTWVSIPGHEDGKINGAHAFGGNELTVKTIEALSGLKIDNYIITDFDGFKPLIDLLGGVTVEVKENLSDSFSGCYLTAGVHHLNGEQALALSRNRHRNGEPGQQGGAFAREREAAKIILALFNQQTTFERFIKMPVFINYLMNYVWTDFTFKDVIRFLPSFGKINTQNIKITTIPSWPEMVGNASAVVYDKEATKELFEEIKNQ
ncbi:MAG TPA: LCP family protein [Candidatus Humimicrobiaceae bacterium]